MQKEVSKGDRREKTKGRQRILKRRKAHCHGFIEVGITAVDGRLVQNRPSAITKRKRKNERSRDENNRRKTARIGYVLRGFGKKEDDGCERKAGWVLFWLEITGEMRGTTRCFNLRKRCNKG